jgi:hypothetical protein
LLLLLLLQQLQLLLVLFLHPSVLDEIDESIGGTVVGMNLFLPSHFRFDGLEISKMF